MSANKEAPYSGQCLCGSISYEVLKIQPRMGHCHCSMCRKFHGAAFATYAEAKKEHFRWVSGESLLQSFQADNGTVRRFCGQCGSSMTFAAADDTQEVVEFALGTLDSDIELRPDVHIYVGSKASWVQIGDDLPEYVDGRNSNRCK